MTDSPRTLTCPSCGSPLQADENDRRVQCQYCHATVDLPDNDPPVVIVPGSIPSKQTLAAGHQHADRTNPGYNNPGRDYRGHPVFKRGDASQE